MPATLPVLPLRDTVTFPDTLTPLAVGQPRSVTLINDVLAADRRLGDGRQQGPRPRGAGARRALRRSASPAWSRGADVDADAANAAYEDGMLIVELRSRRPKRPQSVRDRARARGTEP